MKKKKKNKNILTNAISVPEQPWPVLRPLSIACLLSANRKSMETYLEVKRHETKTHSQTKAFLY